MWHFLRVLFLGKEKAEERKFGNSSLSFPYYRGDFHKYGKSTFIKVDKHGKVVGTGIPIWGKAGLVHFIGIPWIHPDELERIITTTLTRSVGNANLSVDIKITVLFKSIEFDYQELFDEVIRHGFEHIDDWISNLFRTTALSNKMVIDTFDNYIKHERPVLFIEQLGKALKKLQFSGHPLSNIKQIKVDAELNTVKASLQATYDGV